MFKKSFFLLLAVMLSVLSAAEKKSFPKLVPPPIMVNIAKERPTVTPTGEFSSLPVTTAARGKVKVSASSSAALLTEKEKQFTWKPSPLLSSTIRNADLTGAVLSEDGTLVVVTERIGGEEKPNSTRFVLFNVPEQRIARGFVLNEVLIDSAAFIPGSKTEMIAIRRASYFFNTRSALVRISLSNQEIMDYGEIPEQEFTSFAFGDKEKIYSTVAGSSDIFVYDSENLSAEPGKIKSRLSSPAVIFAGSKLIAYGQEGIEIFRKVSGSRDSKGSFFKAPAKFACHNALVIEPTIPAICFTGKFEEDCWYFTKDTYKKIKERTSGAMTWDSRGKMFFAELAANAKVTTFQMPEAVESPKPAAPNRLKPANRNHSFALLRVPVFKEKMVQVDSRGNVFLLDYTKMSRWKKYVIYIADRAGFRN